MPPLHHPVQPGVLDAAHRCQRKPARALALWVGMAALTGAACARGGHEPSDMAAPEAGSGRSGSVVDSVLGRDEFRRLKAALEAAELLEMLEGPGPFTLFAPTDEAFEALPEGALVLPARELSDLLRYHILDGELASADFVSGRVDTVAQWTAFVVAARDGTLVNGARIVETDLPSDNAVVHVIDGVLFPPDLAQVVEMNDYFSQLEQAVEDTQLAGTLSGEGPLTLFAPADLAFDAVPEETLDVSVQVLGDILRYHLVEGAWPSADLVGGDLTTLEGASIHIGVQPRITVNQANIVASDVRATNGVLHIIDRVLAPPAGP